MRGKLLIGVVVILALSAGVVFAVVSRNGDAPAPQEPKSAAAPKSFPSPSRSDRDLTIAFLRHDGAPLLRVHRVAGSVGHLLAANACKTLITRLNRIATGETAAALITNVPDAVLRGLFDNERRALGIGLTSCLSAVGNPNDLSRSLRSQQSLVAKRLDQLGVAQ